MRTSISDISPTDERLAAARHALRRAGRRSFTLVEMLVALAVMILAMAMVTKVFSVTTETTATSAAIADVEMLLRTAAEQMRLDLEGCDPTHSVLAIYGRTQAAALTEEQRIAGQYYREMIGDPGAVQANEDPVFDTTPPAEYSDPRADIMMFFTNRPCVSKAPPRGDAADDFALRLQLGAAHSPVQVVYGHAAVAEPVRNGLNWDFPANGDVTHIEANNTQNLSDLPAARWHLARRQVLLEPFSGGPTNFTNVALFNSISRCFEETSILVAADSTFFDLDAYLREFGAAPNNAINILATRSPYVMSFGGGNYNPPGLQWQSQDYNLIRNILFAPGGGDNPQYHHFATVVEEPPLDLSDNLGLHLLPGCVWFQVEILIPEDPRNSRTHPLSDQRRDTPRWVAVEPDQMYVFVPDSDENRQIVLSQSKFTPGVPDAGTRLETFAQIVPPNNFTPPVNYGGANTVSNRNVRMWPYAVRVTFKAIDHHGRLKQPITRSLVHWFD